MQHMQNLTLASARHLLTQGHITPAHHARIVSAAKSPKKRKAAAPGFGSLVPQQGQAPIPGAPPGADTPDGTASGY